MGRVGNFLGVVFLMAMVCQGDAWMDWLWEWNKSVVSDPDIARSAVELIRSKGYPCEEHFVTTADGFILGLQRIPHGHHDNPSGPSPGNTTTPTSPASDGQTTPKPLSGRGPATTQAPPSSQTAPGPSASKPVVFLQHGLLCSSTNWLTNLANQSFAYILADAGFDVWLGNVRGNVYSKNHTHLSPDSEEFWDWSWDQMAEYDLPAMVDYALSVSGQEQLYYVGHSQGSLMAFAGLSINRALDKKIKMLFGLGPVATVGHMTSPLRYLSAFVPELEFMLNLLGVNEFMPSSKVTQWLAADVCSSSGDIWCENIVFVLSGFNRANLNESRLPVYFAHSPAGTSVQDMVHFAQMVVSGQFQKYDYGSKSDNLQRYNQTAPPLYFPENFHTPTALYWGGQDWLADPQDVKLLIPRLQNLRQSVYIPQYNHLDFIWGMDAPIWVYEPIIQTIRQMEESGDVAPSWDQDGDEGDIGEEGDGEEGGEEKGEPSVSEAIQEYLKKIEVGRRQE